MSSGAVVTFDQAAGRSLPVRVATPSRVFAESTDIDIAGLCKTFDGQRQVLRDIHFSIPRGQAVALIGHNGSGKSTLLRCCLRLVQPCSGAVRLLGSDITTLGARQLRGMRAKVGFVFQRHNLVARLSALSNVLHGVQARKKGPGTWFHSIAPQKDREEAMAQLHSVGLAHLAERRVDGLSGGESQRVAIARALMQRPKIVMADEPVASLDPLAGDEVMGLFLHRIKDDGLTLLFVSHNLDHALRYADRIIGLRDGRVELDTPSKTENLTTSRELYG
ncbi:MAG: ATP-binding cassette domain-containing protein [Desulforhopalus sp.]|jgi:phosphonate transport system ATP-binding protein|nr:ATP-binding cassette domain-containing protein [Desulforhopalus sp.]